jgi:hypothetical protein
MAATLNVEIQDVGVLLVPIKKYQEQLATVGWTEADTQQLETMVATLSQKDVAHAESVHHVHQLTDEQNVLVDRSWNIIGKIRAAAKLRFFRDAVTKKEFHIGAKIWKNVSSTLAELAYVKGLVTNYAAQLAERGIGESDITELNACYDELQANDAEQENAKRVQVALGNERDSLLAAMKDEKRKARLSASICFRNNPTILNEFKSIIRRTSSKKGTTDETTDNSTTETPAAG